MSTVTSAYTIGESIICAYAIGDHFTRTVPNKPFVPSPLNPINVTNNDAVQERLTYLEQAYIELSIEYRKMRERALEAERKLVEIETGK